MRTIVACAGLFLIGWSGASPVSGGDGPLRVNQLQVIGTHNSYHLPPTRDVLSIVGPKGPEMGKGLDYRHRPLAEQFGQQKIRSIELDVFHDPTGGRYARPAARLVLQKMGRDPGPDPDAGGRLRSPGFKVFHIQDIDFRSTVATLSEALGQVQAWSAAHPDHVPILVQLEPKENFVLGLPTRPSKLGKEGLDALDAEIRSIFPARQRLTPDDLRGDCATLPEAIKSRGWPSVDDARGRVIFAMDARGETADLYLEGHPALKGREMFVDVPAGDPAAAWMVVNDPIKEFDQIRRLVESGYLVRTRADADTVEARADDATRRDRAFASGAQFISTDFPDPRPEFSNYRVQLPDHAAARVNPVTGNASSPTVPERGPSGP